MASATSSTSSQETTRSLRRVRWAQIAIFSLVGAALVGTAAQSFFRAGRVYEAVALGQGHGLLRALHHSLGFRGPPDEKDIEGFLEANADLGLRCVDLVGPGDKVTRIGDCVLADKSVLSLVSDARPDRLVEIDGRVALVAPRPPEPPPPPPRGELRGRQPEDRNGVLPPPPPPPEFEPRPEDNPGGPPFDSALFHGRGERGPGPGPERPGPGRGPGGGPEPGPGPGRGFRPGPGGPGPHPPPPRFLIEFVPVEANQLRGAATTGLFTAFGAVAALILAGLALSRLSRRAEELNESAERQRQLASLGEMSAVLAHEIRNPLASLKGHAQLLLETLDANGRDHQKAERIVREATRMEALSEDLLSLVRSSRVEPVPVDPAAIVREVAHELGAERFAIDTSRAPRTWRLDPARVRQVLDNLVRNALEASPPEAPVEITVGTEGGRLTLSVRDHGAGVAAGEEERIFEPFITNRVRGTGLGLAVARRIVELHGGRISVNNRDGGGAEFLVVLP